MAHVYMQGKKLANKISMENMSNINQVKTRANDISDFSNFLNTSENNFTSPNLTNLFLLPNTIFDLGIIIYSLGCATVNLVALGIILYNDREARKIKRANYLVANVCGICTPGILLFLCERERYVKGPTLCPLSHFFRTTFLNAVSATVLGISYERLRKFRPNLKKLQTYQMLLIIWGISMILAIPTIFCIKFDDAKNACVKKHINDDISITIGFEILRFLVFHGIVSAILIYEIFEVKSQFKYINQRRPTKTWKLKKRTQRVRFLYINSTVFLLFWLPFGGLLSFNKVARKPIPEQVRFPINWVVASMLFFGLIYIFLLPLIILLTSDNLKKRRGKGKKKRLTEKAKGEGGTGGGFGIEMKELEATPTATADIDRTVFDGDKNSGDSTSSNSIVNVPKIKIQLAEAEPLPVIEVECQVHQGKADEEQGEHEQQ